MRAVALAVALAGASAASPLIAWSTSANNRLKSIAGGNVVSRGELLDALGSAPASVGGASTAHAFIFVDLQLAGQKIGSLLSSQASAALSSQITAAPASLIAPYSKIATEAEQSNAAAWANVFRERRCSVVAVGEDVASVVSGADRAISRQQYAEEIASVPAIDSCTTYVVPLTASSGVEAEIAFVAASTKAATAAGSATFFLASNELAPASESVEVPAAMTADRPGSARRLAPGTTTTTTLYLASGHITMTPGILTGLLIGLMLLFFVAVGLSCVASVATPDQLMSTTLPAGKEY